MIKTKLLFKSISFLNRQKMENYIQNQYSNGWKLTKIGLCFLTFKKCEPKNTNISINYYPDASFYDSKPNDNLLSYYDLCEHSHWSLLASSSYIQVFENDNINLIPLETDPTIEFNTYNKIIKNNYLKFMYFLLIITFLGSIINLYNFNFSFLSFMRNNLSLINLIFTPLIALLSLLGIINYSIWYKKSNSSLIINDTIKINKFFYFSIYTIGLLSIIYLILISISFNYPYSLICIGSFILILLIHILMIKLFKKGKSTKEFNCFISCSITTLLLITSIFTLDSLTSNFVHNKKDENNIYHDELPLKIEDYMDINTNNYNYQHTYSSTSILIDVNSYQQYNSKIGLDKHILNYKIVDIKNPNCYQRVKSDMLNILKNSSNTIDNNQIININASIWEANEVYQLKEDKLLNNYLLCYTNKIIFIDFDDNYTLTNTQIENIIKNLI